MRRRPGIAGLQTAAAAKGQYKALGENVARERTDQMKEQLEVFRRNLEDFALKHKTDIRRHPEFRAQFHAMCAKCGVDPLASRKGFWAELLGIGDFYFELGVQITDVCLAARHSGSSGLMDLGELRAALQARRRTTAAMAAAEAITEDDCIRAVAKLKALGGGFDVVTIGQRRYVRSVPNELSTDHAQILRLAQGGGHVTEKLVQDELHWDAGRTTDVLDALLKEGVAMIDDGDADCVRRYWFPCVSVQDASVQ